MNTDVIRISSAEASALENCLHGRRGIVRKVSYGKERVLVENVTLDEPLEEVPRHWDSWSRRCRW